MLGSNSALPVKPCIRQCPPIGILRLNQEHGAEKTIKFEALRVLGGQMTLIAAISLLVFLGVGAIATDLGLLAAKELRLRGRNRA
jgi:hypothetical protein